MTSILKFDVSRYGYPMRIQGRLSQELLQLFALYVRWLENENTSFWKWNKIKNIQKMRE